MVENEGSGEREGQERGDKVPVALFLLPALALIVMAAAIVISFLPSG